MNATDLAFSPAVKAEQQKRGSRFLYERARWETEIPEDLAQWLGERDSIYLATASKEGQPYVQHRGGPPGFLKVLDPKTLAFADYAGNRQYISVGNLAENPRAFLFAMDYEHQRRFKFWGKARFSEDPQLLQRLGNGPKKAKIERALIFEVQAWDANCPQHIPRKLGEPRVLELLQRIRELEAENAALKSGK